MNELFQSIEPNSVVGIVVALATYIVGNVIGKSKERKRHVGRPRK